MKRLIVMMAGLATVATGVVGCLSAQLRSEDPQTRLAAVGEVKEQAVLQEIAQGTQYQDDVRVAAMKRLSDPQDLWHIWSENENKPEIARGALDAFKDDDYLVRVSLSARTNEALVAVGRLSSLSACSNVAVNCAAPSVQLVAFRKFLEQTQDEDALRYALEHGQMRGAGVKYAPEEPEGAESIPLDVLDDAYQAIDEFAQHYDKESIRMVLASLKEYHLPEMDKARTEVIEKALEDNDWAGIRYELGLQ